MASRESQEDDGGGAFPRDLQSSSTSMFAPAPSNFYEPGGNGAFLEEVYYPTLNASRNVDAHKLATSTEEQQEKSQFAKVFNLFHDASIKIKVDDVQGSGILFQSDESQLVIVTTAHIFNDLKEESKIEICLETGYTSSGGVIKFTILLIPLDLSDVEITRNDDKDVVVIALGESAGDQVRQYVHDENFPSASFMDEDNVLFMMIHYANAGHKQVTTCRREDYTYKTFKECIHMDGGPGASGAPIYSLSGNVVAIHKCHLHNHQEIRSCISIKDVIDVECYENAGNSLEVLRSPTDHSHVYKVLVSEAKEQYEYNPISMANIVKDHPFDTNEGQKSQNLLLDKIGELPRDHLTTNGLPKISNAATLTYIKTNYRGAIQQTVFESLGKGGKYKETQKWSFKEKIDSDHFPPHDAYQKALKMSRNREIKRRINVAGGRDNEPAITIPKDVHRKLDTTGSSADNKKFRKEQATLMSEGNFADAIKMNFTSYKDHGLFTKETYPRNLTDEKFKTLLDKYREGFTDALQEHVKLNFINSEQKKQLLDYLLPPHKKI